MSKIRALVHEPRYCAFMTRTLPFVCVFVASVFSFAGAAHAQAAAPDDGRKSLLIMNFEKTGEVDDGTVATVADLMSSAMVQTDRFRVMTGDDIAKLMELEAGKQAFGCMDDSCLAEVAGALGAEIVITGRIGRLGSLYVLKTSIMEPSTATTMGLETVEVDSVEAFSRSLGPISKRFAALAYGEEPPPRVAPPPVAPVAPVAAEEGAGFGLGSMLLIGGGAVAGIALVAAAAAGIGAAVTLGVVNDPSSSGAEKAANAENGPLMMSLASGAVGIAVLGGGIAATGLFIE